MVRASRSSSSIWCLARSSSSRRAFSSTVGRLDRQGLQQFAIAARPGPRRSRANPCTARPPSRCRPAGRWCLAPVRRRMRTSGTQMTLRSSRSATLFCGSCRRADRVEVHGQQFAAMLQRAVDHLSRHPQIGLSQLVPAAGAARRAFPGLAGRSSRNPRSAPVIVRAVSTTRGQHVVDREGGLQRARQVQDRAQLCRGLRRRPCRHRLAPAPHTCSISRFSSAPSGHEQQLIGILRRRIRSGRSSRSSVPRHRAGR